MSTSVVDIETQIELLVKDITEILAVYKYPVTELGRKFPALVILYNGFTAGSAPNRSTETRYNYEFTLYLPLEGRNIEITWAELKVLVPKILDKFRANPGLGSTVWWSIIEAGEPIIQIPMNPADKPKWIGHSFRLRAQKEET